MIRDVYSECQGRVPRGVVVERSVAREGERISQHSSTKEGSDRYMTYRFARFG
jgi:hypothetical protein